MCRCNSDIPPQSLLFPLTEIAVAFLKMPFFGTAPLNSLNDRFSFSKKTTPSKYTGIFLEKSLRERSNSSIPNKLLKDEGRVPRIYCTSK